MEKQKKRLVGNGGDECVRNPVNTWKRHFYVLHYHVAMLCQPGGRFTARVLCGEAEDVGGTYCTLFMWRCHCKLRSMQEATESVIG